MNEVKSKISHKMKEEKQKPTKEKQKPTKDSKKQIPDQEKTEKVIQEQKYIKIGIIITLIILFVIVILGAVRSITILGAILALIIAIVGTLYILDSFSEEEKHMDLESDEHIIYQTPPDMGVSVLFPRRKGGFMGKKYHRDVNILLTNRKIAVEKRITGKCVLSIPRTDIKKFSVEEKLSRGYIRLTYIEKGKEKEVLLITEDTAVWAEKLREVLELGYTTPEE